MHSTITLTTQREQKGNTQETDRKHRGTTQTRNTQETHSKHNRNAQEKHVGKIWTQKGIRTKPFKRERPGDTERDYMRGTGKRTGHTGNKTTVAGMRIGRST